MAPSSPRLPSPPPPAEDQIGPQSPSMGAQAARQTTQMEQTLIDANAKRRVHPGTKAADMAAGPPLVPLNELDSAFQLQEHLAALHHYHTLSTTEPITRATAHQLATPPPSIDRTLWLYELCRFLISQCNTLIVGFLFDAPPCSATTCPEMRASEWQFLCAVHEQPKSCCAIDYCCHTLDWAANVVTDPKIFPSRFVVSADSHVKGVAVKNLVNVFRRLHRIFAHAWFQHKAVFWSIESQTGLYVFFKTVCDMYELLPAENYKLPPEAEGLEPAGGESAGEGEGDGKKGMAGVTIAKPPNRGNGAAEGNGNGAGNNSDNGNGLSVGTGVDPKYHSIGRTNTRRHIRASPSTGSAVTTVMETEEEDHDVSNRLKELTISAPETVEEEEEAEIEVPVIVEQDVMDDAATTIGGGEPDKAAEDSPQGEESAATDVAKPAETDNEQQEMKEEEMPEAPAETVETEASTQEKVEEPSAETEAATESKPEDSPAPAEEEKPAEKEVEGEESGDITVLAEAADDKAEEEKPQDADDATKEADAPATETTTSDAAEDATQKDDTAEESSTAKETRDNPEAEAKGEETIAKEP